MQLDRADEEARALLNLLIQAIEADRFPQSPRVQMLRTIRGKFGSIGEPPSRPAAPPLKAGDARGLGGAGEIEAICRD
jgi:hypothetical protein